MNNQVTVIDNPFRICCTAARYFLLLIRPNVT